MPDINYSTTLNVSRGFLSNTINVSGITATMNADGMQSATYVLSVTPTTIGTASLSAVGLAFLRNISTATASTCAVGVVSGGSMVPFSSPRPGETAILRLASGVTYQATGSAGSRLRVDITEA